MCLIINHVNVNLWKLKGFWCIIAKWPLEFVWVECHEVVSILSQMPFVKILSNLCHFDKNGSFISLIIKVRSNVSHSLLPFVFLYELILYVLLDNQLCIWRGSKLPISLSLILPSLAMLALVVPSCPPSPFLKTSFHTLVKGKSCQGKVFLIFPLYFFSFHYQTWDNLEIISILITKFTDLCWRYILTSLILQRSLSKQHFCFTEFVYCK